MKNIPIIYSPHKIGLKRNALDYLFVPLSLASVVRSNPDADVYFLNVNDAYPLNVMGVHDVDVREIQVSATVNIKKSYKHLSTNHADFELFCIERFFVIRDFMKSRNMECAFLIETDVLLFTNLNQFFENVPDFEWDKIYLSEKKCISLAYVTYEFISFYCDFVLNCYESSDIYQKISTFYDKYIERGGKGGICDMTFCEYISNGMYGSSNNFKIKNFSDVFSSVDGDTFLFDSFIGRDGILDSEIKFEMDKSYIDNKVIKKVSYIDSQPFVHSTSGNVNLGSLHCQGAAKGLMANYFVNT